MILMACKTSGDSGRRVPGTIFPVIQDSFTTQGLARPKTVPRPHADLHLGVNHRRYPD